MKIILSNKIFIITLLISITFCFYFVSNKIASKNRIQFVNEEICISIFDNKIQTRGVYFFKNKGIISITHQIRYPFPTDKYAVESISIDNNEIDYIIDGKSIYFNITFEALEEKKLEIIYSEDYKEVYTYILTTTASWHQPLENAFFEIINNVNDSSLEINYSFEKIAPNKYKYYVETFMPEQNLIININKYEQ